MENFTGLQDYLDVCNISWSLVLPSNDTEAARVSACSSLIFQESTIGTACATLLNITMDLVTSATTVLVPNATITINNVVEGTARSQPESQPTDPTSPRADGGQSTSRSLNTRAIAGGTVGGVTCIALIVGLFFFIRRHRKRKFQPGNEERTEKAQLHSDDIKPDRKELFGSKVPQDMLERKTVLSELPANEEVIRRNGQLEELPSNEPVGQEMETTENEMRELDRLAGSTQVSSKTN